MQAKFKILLCVMFMLGLAVSQVNAQAQFNITVDRNEVAQEGHNQMMGALNFEAGAAEAGEADITVQAATEDNMTGIVISYGGLKIANSVEDLRTNKGATCAEAFGTDNCSAGTEVGVEDADVTDNFVLSLSTDKTKLMLMWGSGSAFANLDEEDTIALGGIRVDVSGKDPGDEIVASISVAGSGDAVDIGGGDAGRASTVVSTVRAGLSVPDVASASLLTCNPDGATASITVKEGFGSAWQAIGSDATSAYSGEATQIFVQVLNVPAGVTFDWPESVKSAVVDEDVDGNPANKNEVIHRDAGEALLTLESATMGSSAIYSYSEPGVTGEKATDEASAYTHSEHADSFKITPVKVKAGATTVGGGTPADAWAFLYPAIGNENARSRRLSYKKNPQTDKNEDNPNLVEGQFVTVADCVTYLLFPYVTCGEGEWDTAFSIANTTKDDAVFGKEQTEKDKAAGKDPGGVAPQAGAVYVHSYPKSPKTADGASGTVPDGTTTMVSSALNAGDTLTFMCSPAFAGNSGGYAIVEARFREAYGMAFVMGDFSGGAAVDVAHGYMAEVIGEGDKMRD